MPHRVMVRGERMAGFEQVLDRPVLRGDKMSAAVETSVIDAGSRPGGEQMYDDIFRSDCELSVGLSELRSRNCSRSD